MRECCNIAVPLFLAISGYFIGRKKMENPNDYFTFLSKQIPRVYIPCIIWSLPVLLIYLYHNFPIGTSLLRIMSCSAFGPYYFIALILQLYILHPIINYVYKKRLGWTVILINALSVLLLNYYIIKKIGDSNLPFVILAGPFVYWFAFYYLGRKAIGRDDVSHFRIVLFITILLWAIQLIEASYIGVGIKLSSWIWAYVSIILLFCSKIQNLYYSHETNILLKGIKEIGKYSFGIYLSHVYVLLILEKVHISGIWLVNWLVTLITAYLLVKLLEAVFNHLPYRQFTTKYFGLK